MIKCYVIHEALNRLFVMYHATLSNSTVTNVMTMAILTMHLQLQLLVATC